MLGEGPDDGGFGLGRGRGGRLSVSPVWAVMHGLHLLELIGGEDAGELLLGIFLDGVKLLTAVLRGGLGVGHESGDFLVAVGEDGLDFGGLVGREVELLAQELGRLVRIASVVAEFAAVMAFDRRRSLLLIWLLGCLCESEAAG
jgi:hypothetical protein